MIDTVCCLASLACSWITGTSLPLQEYVTMVVMMMIPEKYQWLNQVLSVL